MPIRKEELSPADIEKYTLWVLQVLYGQHGNFDLYDELVVDAKKVEPGENILHLGDVAVPFTLQGKEITLHLSQVSQPNTLEIADEAFPAIHNKDDWGIYTNDPRIADTTDVVIDIAMLLEALPGEGEATQLNAMIIYAGTEMAADHIVQVAWLLENPEVVSEFLMVLEKTGTPLKLQMTLENETTE